MKRVRKAMIKPRPYYRDFPKANRNPSQIKRMSLWLVLDTVHDKDIDLDLAQVVEYPNKFPIPYSPGTI